MKIKLNSPHSCDILIDVDQNSGVLLQALSNSLLVESSGYGDEKVWKTSEKTLTFEIVADDFTAAPVDVVKRLQQEVASHTTNWLKAYQAQQKAENDLKAIQLQLKEKGITLN